MKAGICDGSLDNSGRLHVIEDGEMGKMTTTATEVGWMFTCPLELQPWRRPRKTMGGGRWDDDDEAKAKNEPGIAEIVDKYRAAKEDGDSSRIGE